ncbi:carotenoid biosynthesis protein [Candidatus Saccharibacteria bacterium]|nr:carotenoid biosynthesis protein [Candidatus Saccharibacteria bacterium]
MKLRKMVIGLEVILFFAAYFVAKQPITPELGLIASISVVLFAVPSYWATVKSLGKRRGLLLLAALGIYTLFIESLALKTGFPYGDFTYTDVLGNKVFGLTPWTVAFAYPPLLLLTYWYARMRHSNRWKIYFSTAFDAMLLDLVLDPAAVRLGFWYWDKPGFYYQVPLINFLGWLLTGYIGAIILHYLWGRTPKPTLPVAYSGLLILWFWTSVNVWLLQIVPALLGLLISVFLTRYVLYKNSTITP